jgi:hypothetical protein
MDNTIKPKLLFLRFACSNLPTYIQFHLEEQKKCLSQFFDVAVIDGPCDYRKLCDKHQPDLALFESGVWVGQRDITNISACPEIPKIGFCHCDAYCANRERFIYDMARWGIETFFTTALSLASYTPSLADKLFVWPNFADPAIYHDYGLPKLIPVLFTGSQAPHYPWRNHINKIVSQYYPSLQCPHFGWSDERATSGMIFGQDYARMINAARIAPTCGTIAKEVVRKHFEIPACNTCLVTERTPGLEAAGFRDLVNCVFADRADVLDKLEGLFQHPDELRKITQAGHDLVQSLHTIDHRNQVFQWFTLYKKLKPHQRIVQLGPFMPLTIVYERSGIKNGHINSAGLDRMLLAEGDDKLWAGRYSEAETLYRRCLNYHDMPEPKLRLALSCLYKGDAGLALRWVSESIQSVLGRDEDAEPDPVEWAYSIVALLCLGKPREAVERAKRFQTLYHPELERVRAVTRIVSDQPHESTLCKSQNEYRCSVHQLPERKMGPWLEELCKMLKACRQDDMAKRLAPSAMTWGRSQILPGPGSSPPRAPSSHRAMPGNNVTSSRAELTIRRKAGQQKATSWLARAKGRLRRIVKMVALRPLQQVELGIGYFLPYRWSAIRYDECVLAVRQLLRENDIRSGLLIGAANGEAKTEAFLQGMSENRNRPFAVCRNFATPRFIKLRRRLAKNAFVECRCISKAGGWHEDQNESFDAVVIDGSEMVGDIGFEDNNRAHFIVLDDINAPHVFRLCRMLLAEGNYILLDYNPSHRGGYAIFRKRWTKECADQINLDFSGVE